MAVKGLRDNRVHGGREGGDMGMAGMDR